MTTLRALLALATFTFAACSSTAPTPRQIERYYAAAEEQAQRDIDRLAEKLNRGDISPDEYQRRELAIKESIPRRASNMAWASHELAESEMRGMGIPTGGAPGTITAPSATGGSGTNGTIGSFYRPAGQVGGGNQGLGSGISRGVPPTAATTATAASGLRN